MRQLNRAVVLGIGIVQATAGLAQASPPWCGGRARDLGGGFRLTQYMFGGSPEFRLEYDVPNEAIEAGDVTVAASPIRLLFGGLDSPAGELPTFGFENFDVRERDGRKYELRSVRLECGGGQALSVAFGASFPANQPAGPISFNSVFSDRAPIPACLAALEEAGRFTLSFARDAQAAPDLVLRGPLPLGSALREARRLWEEDRVQARNGLCRIMPPPPPAD